MLSSFLIYPQHRYNLILTHADLPRGPTLLSLPAEILLQVARELYTFPIVPSGFVDIETLLAGGPTLAELQAEAQQELQLFTLLYVNRQLRNIALGIFQIINGGKWNGGTHAQRLDRMREEEARILFQKVCGYERYIFQEPAKPDVFMVVVAEYLKDWEKQKRFARHPSVWEKVLSRTGATSSAIAFTLALWKDGQTGHTGMCLPTLQPLAIHPLTSPLSMLPLSMSPLPIVPWGSVPQGPTRRRPLPYDHYLSDLSHS